MHLILLDDGRSALRGTDYEEALHCIRCGACLYACPVYRQIGGHAYGATYSGPIGAVITPALEGLDEDSGEMAWLSSLCGACSEACPVKIPLDDHLVLLRADARARDPHRGEAALFAGWARLWAKPGAYRATAATGAKALAPLWSRIGGGGRDGWLARVPFPFSGWTTGREIRRPAAEPFHARWKAKRGR
jgi:L-lactate dehydrogenase complex protein LldF